MQTRFAFHILHLALRDVGAGRSPKLRVTVLVLIAIAAGAVEGRAQASCRPRITLGKTGLRKAVQEDLPASACAPLTSLSTTFSAWSARSDANIPSGTMSLSCSSTGVRRRRAIASVGNSHAELRSWRLDPVNVEASVRLSYEYLPEGDIDDRKTHIELPNGAVVRELD
jgi:hypothetical protein